MKGSFPAQKNDMGAVARNPHRGILDPRRRADQLRRRGFATSARSRPNQRRKVHQKTCGDDRVFSDRSKVVGLRCSAALKTGLAADLRENTTFYDWPVAILNHVHAIQLFERIADVLVLRYGACIVTACETAVGRAHAPFSALIIRSGDGIPCATDRPQLINSRAQRAPALAAFVAAFLLPDAQSYARPSDWLPRKQPSRGDAP